METGKIITISGPLVVAENIKDVKMFDIVKVGKNALTGEVIQMKDNMAWIQVYEETSGLRIGEEVITTKMPLSVKLGPGLLRSFYDGIQRPLNQIASQTGIFIKAGVVSDPLPTDISWEFVATKKAGAEVQEGDEIGTVKETEIIVHKILIPVGLEGKIIELKSGSYKIDDPIGKLQIKDSENIVDLYLYQYWPVRKPRPVSMKVTSKVPLKTGQRVIDTFFPILKGGTAITPGPFGSGKSVTQHQLAKWSDAQVVVYVGCGERGNEMTDLLVEFPELKDPNTDLPLTDKSVLIANTSNMPIAAREASIYTGITIAEYYRDMGYDVSLMADSTSRWAEALREMSGRLMELPGEESYPAYLVSRIAEFYERAGMVQPLGRNIKQGSVTVIGAVSPAGGDFAEPVTQSSLQFTKVFLKLDADLANASHFPAINWLGSYSLYNQEIDKYYSSELSPKFPEYRKRAMAILQKEDELLEIIRIVGMDALSLEDQILLETAKSLREDYMQQNAFDMIDGYSSHKKMLLILTAIMRYHNASVEIVTKLPDINQNLLRDNPIKEKIANIKNTPESEIDQIEVIVENIVRELINYVKSNMTDELDEGVGLNDIVNNLID